MSSRWPSPFYIYIIRALIGVRDDFLSVIPQPYHPDTLLGFHLPGLGLLLLITEAIFMNSGGHFKQVVMLDCAGSDSPPAPPLACRAFKS